MPPTPDELADIQKRLNLISFAVSRLTLAVQNFLRTKKRRDLLYGQARLFLGRDASPLDLVNDDLGCAESVSCIIAKVTQFPIITGTSSLNAYLARDPRFQNRNDDFAPGTVIVSPTGSGQAKIRGHVGIFGENETIMSASSIDGLWKQNFTLQTWRRYYEEAGGLETFYYTLI